MIEILLLTILVFALSGYVALWVRARRSRRYKPVPLTEVPVEALDWPQRKLPTKEELHRKEEEDWLVQYALSMSPSEQRNMENVWNDLVEKTKPSTQRQREWLRRDFLIKVARKKIQRELGGS